MSIEKNQFKCMNTFTHNNRFRTSNQPLPDQNKIFEHKNIKNAGKPKQIVEKDIFEFEESKNPKDKQSKKPKTKAKAKPKPKKDIFDPNESIGNHNKVKLKNY
tara:strand:- start:230 stop:538 length:309 start_codon:yes stop_codon:yes gene_type:complete